MQRNSSRLVIPHCRHRHATPSPSAVGTSSPQSDPISPEQNRRDDTKNQRQASQETVSPGDTHGVVQLRTEKREAESCHGSDECRRSRSTCRVARIRINHVSLRALERNDCSARQYGCAHVRDYPVNLLLGSESVDEETNSRENGAG